MQVFCVVWGSYWVSKVNYNMLASSWSLARLSFFQAQLQGLQGLKVLPIRQTHAIQQSAAYGEKSASGANQEWSRRRQWSRKQAPLSTISRTVRNMMIKTDRMLSAFQPAALKTFIWGWWGMVGLRGRYFPLGKVHLPRLVFTSIFQISPSLPCRTLICQISDVLRDNVDVHFPTRKKEHLVLMFHADHNPPSGWVLALLLIFY